MKTALTELGLIIAYSDASVFYIKDAESKVYAIVYVDDFQIMGPSKKFNTYIKTSLLSKFKGKDLGVPQSFLGMLIQINMELGTIKLSNPRHIEELIKTYRLEDAKIAYVPMDKSLDLARNNGTPAVDVNVVPYRQLVGSLLYLAMTTRPDIAYAVGILTRAMSCPTENHWKAAKQVARYLKGTMTHGLVYGNPNNECSLNMYAYCDADHAGDRDTGLSTYGYAFMLNGAAVGWRSRKQETVAKSTAEAEIVAASLTTTEALWFQKVLTDLGLDTHITIGLDNTNALATARREGNAYPNRNKHIRVHVLSVFEQMDYDNTITYKYVPTNEQVADIFTKPLDRPKFELFRARLGLHA